MTEKHPNVIVLAGPNGSGKSTAAPTFLRDALHVDEFVNADTIALGLSGFNPANAAIQAGRAMLGRLQHLAGTRRDFAFETTLASRSFVPWIKDLQMKGYRFSLLFFFLSSPELAVQRVLERVRRGGHFVPEEVVRRRFFGSIRNFLTLYQPLADNWFFYDNSHSERVLIAEGEKTELRIFSPKPWEECLGMLQGETSKLVREPEKIYGSTPRDGDWLISTEELTEALNQANRIALWDHKVNGNPVVVSENGKIVWIQPEDIPIEKDPRNP